MSEQNGTTQPAWHETASLVALRSCITEGALMRTALAKSAGLSESELLTLQHLVERPQGPADLARRLSVSTAAMTAITDRLEVRRHVVRTPHPRDRRRVVLTVTAGGREELRERLLPMFAELARFDANYSDAERLIVASYLNDAAAAFARVAESADNREQPDHPK